MIQTRKSALSLHRRHPALDMAIAHLKEVVRGGRYRTGQRLPTVQQLAHNAGVSVPTMCKALGEIRKTERMSISPRRGITLGPAPPSLASDSPPPLRHAEKIALELQGDIAQGKYSGFRYLPSSKELCATYGVCFTTFRKILANLSDKGIVKRYRKRYQVQMRLSRPSSVCVLLILGQGLYRQIEKYGVLRTSLYRRVNSIERECNRRNIRLVVKEFSRDTDLLRGLPQILGAAILLDPYFPPPSQTNALVRSLLHLKRPLFLFEGARKDIYGDLPSSRMLFSLTMASDQVQIDPVGLEVGRFLLNNGHRKICFFAHEVGLWWSDARLKAIRSVYDTADLTDAVTAFYATNPRNLPVAGGYVATGEVPRTDELARSARILTRSMKSFTNAFPSSFYRDRILGDMEELAICFSGTWNRFIPLMNDALAIKDVTAWAAAEDQIAINAIMPFLDSRGVKVPQRMSVIGINNTPESLLHDLTTFDYNPEATGPMIIDLFTSPEHGWGILTRHGNLIDTVGYIVDRGSVRKI